MLVVQLSVSPVATNRNTILVPNVGPLHQQNCTSTSYREPNPKFSQPIPTAGGRFQTIQTIKVHKTLTGKVAKTVKVETVRKMTPPPMPTTIQVIGTVTLDPINYDEFVQTFNAPRQNIEQ